MTTTTPEKPAAREPAYRVGKDAEGLTLRERQVRQLLAEGKTQQEIAAELGVNKQRVSEIKLKLEKEGKLEIPKPLDTFSKSEWRAVSAALRKYAADATSLTPREAAGRALEKTRQLLPADVSW